MKQENKDDLRFFCKCAIVSFRIRIRIVRGVRVGVLYTNLQNTRY
jgi:hypothetical protein